MGFSISLHSSERRSLINWRMPYAVAAARLWLPPATPPVLRRLQLRCICACQRDSRSFVCIPFQDSPRYGDLPVVKTNNPMSVQLFCDCGLSFVRAKCKLAADQPICCAFAPRYALWRLDTRFGALQQSLIAKKLQFRAFFCFWAPKIASNDAAG